MNVSIIGVGRYGRLLLKQFNNLCNIKSYSLQNHKKSINKSYMDKEHPNIPFMTEEDILKDEEIDAVVIATPISTHYDLTKEFLNAGKHVFVEKPLSTKYEQALELDRLAKYKDLILFVGNKFLYHPLIPIIKELDRIHYFDANFTWKKNGTFGENIFWNLLIHDLTVCVELFGIPNQTKIRKKYKDIGALELRYNDRKILIDHNRVSSHYSKTVELLSTTNKGKNYLWDKDCLTYIPKDNKTYDFIGTDLIYLEVIKFIDQINKKELSDNSSIIEAIKILDDLGI